MSETCLIWPYMWTDWVRRKPPQIKKKILWDWASVQYLNFLCSIPPPRGKRREVSIYGLLLYQEARQVLPKEERPWLTQKGRVGSLSDTFQLLHRLERHGHFFVGFVCECSVPLRRWHWRCVCSVLLEECFSYSYQYCHVSCMLPLC